MPTANREPHYTLVEDVYKRHPVVEILKDGGPVHPYDERFGFGLVKARWLLAALDAIQDSVDSDGDSLVKAPAGHCEHHARRTGSASRRRRPSSRFLIS